MRAPYYKVWLNTGAKKKDVTEMIEQIRFEDSVVKDALVHIFFNSNYSLTALADEELTNGTYLAFQFGYLEGKVSKVYLAKIADIDADYGATVTLEVKALSVSNDMKKVDSTRVYKQMTAKQIVEEIAKKYNLKTKVDDSGKVWDSLPQGNMTDHEFLQSLTTKEEAGNYICYTRNNILYFVRKGLNKKSQMTVTIGSHEGFIRFRTKLRESHKHSKTASGVNMSGVNPKTKEPFVNTITEKKTISLSPYKYVYGEGLDKVGSSDGTQVFKYLPVNPPFAADVHKNYVTPLPANDDECEDTGNALKKDGNANVRKGVLDMEGEPDYEPDSVVTMANVAKRHQGNWYVETVIHHLTRSGYICSFEMNQPASTEKPAEVNKTKGPEQAEVKIQATVYDSSLYKIAERKTDNTYTAPQQ